MKTTIQKYRAKVKRTRNRADKLWQELIVKLKPVCYGCGKPSQLGHHWIAKSLSSFLRYSIANGCPLCMDCHLKVHATADGELTDRINAQMTDKEYLIAHRRTKVKTNLKFYQGHIKFLEWAIKETTYASAGATGSAREEIGGKND